MEAQAGSKDPAQIAAPMYGGRVRATIHAPAHSGSVIASPHAAPRHPVTSNSAAVTDTRHLVPALAAVSLSIAVLTGGYNYARSLEARYANALAPLMFEQKSQGIALQREAFRHPDLLVLYGSSELEIANPYHASEIFRGYPTGFTVFPVGKAGAASLTFVQKLAAVGTGLQGKRFAISLSPSAFYLDGFGQSYYAGNFSHLQANALAFGSEIPLPIRRAAARRMLEYPETLEHARVLKFALEQLADGSALSTLLYYAALPVGKLQVLVLRLEDHWQTVAFIRTHRRLKAVTLRTAAPIDWSSLLARADHEQQEHANNNPFGIENELWSVRARQLEKQKHTAVDGAFLDKLRYGREWDDLDLLLREIKSLGGEPMLLSMPIHGPYYDFMGISPEARRVYYERLHELAACHAVPVIDFADHDEDRYFLRDRWAHLSRKGWVCYAQALDAFYHGSLR